MEITQICENIQSEMDKIIIKDSKRVIRALSELMYSASEGGLFPFAIKENVEFESLIKIIEVAKKFKDDLPTRFTL